MSVNRQVSFGPTLTEFIRDPARRKFLVGPLGSGKTVACIHMILLLAQNQEKAPDGKRYTRWAVCRETLQQAKQTVLKDMKHFFRGFAEWKVSDSTMFIHSDEIDCEIVFYPLDTPEDQKRLLSTQLTGVFFNEFIEIDPELCVAAYGRTGRYPSDDLGKPTWYGLFGDSNPGTTDSPWYTLLKEELPKGWAYYEQGDPLDENGELRPDADNAENLPPTYYQDLTDGATVAWIERYVHGKWGDSLSGEAVFKESFSPKFHISSSELSPVRGQVLLVGLDTGRHPAAVFAQVDAFGRFLVLAEAHHDNMGMEKFIQQCVRPIVYSERFVGCPVACVVDPAGNQKSQIGEESVIDAIKRMGFSAYPASTNAISPRIRAVEHFMLEHRDGKPAFLVDMIHCPHLLKAIRRGYHYKIRKTDQELLEVPEKNHPHSDLADALQYAALGTGSAVMGKIMRMRNASPERPPPVAGWAA